MSISLSAGLRSAVYALGDVNNLITTSNNRLATGRKVNSAIDNARAYFSAQAFSTEADKLNGLIEGLTQGRQTIDKATKAIDGAIKLLQSADSLAKSAQNSASDTDRFNYRDQVLELLTQAGRLFSDSGFNGKQILINDVQTGATLTKSLAALGGGTAAEKAVISGGTLDIQTNTATTGFTKITIAAIDVRLGATTANGGLNITRAAAGAGDTGFILAAAGGTITTGAAAGTAWDLANNQAQITQFRTDVQNALNTLAAKSASVATQAATIDIRVQFTRDTSRINSQASDDLVLADINQEGANLTSLQTKQQLAVQALSLASRSDQAILRIFG
jgi:flagellin-like hook-associated protein FlgL